MTTTGTRDRRRLDWRWLALGAAVLVAAVVIAQVALRDAVDLSSATSWRLRLEPDQTDPTSGPDNEYSFAWIKSSRSSPDVSAWRDEGLLRLADYPDGLVMIERKRFDRGAPGRTTNFHLVGGDEVHGGVSPLSADYSAGRSSDWPADVSPGLVLTSQASLDEGRRGHWQLATADEIDADRGAVWTLVWRIRWAAGGAGDVRIDLLRDGAHVRTVHVDDVSTVYADQKPELYVWLGGYLSSGTDDRAEITQSLDQRGRTIEEALADTPELGSHLHSRSTGGGPSSSIRGGDLAPLDVAQLRAELERAG